MKFIVQSVEIHDRSVLETLYGYCMYTSTSNHNHDNRGYRLYRALPPVPMGW